ncbi:MAG: SGNH/GDSL hydrolase family protein [Clostridia bacterium]|nr:SGNH/GDSL hydrolase family protein [Clostridia bacterium]
MNIAFLGDSITLGYGLENPACRFSAVLCGQLGANEINHGICGTLVACAGLSRENGTAYVDRIGSITGADRIVIFGGTNDYFWSDTPIEGDTPAHFRYAVRELIRAAKERYPTDRILFVTPYSHHGIGNFAGGETWNTSSGHDTTAVNWVGHTLADYADVIVTECAQADVLCLNLHTLPFDWRALTLDGCHPNADGHRWLCEQMLETGFFDGVPAE